MRVTLKKPADISKLTFGREYVVIGISDVYYRLHNDRSEPILYVKEMFQVKEATIPRDWVRRDFSDGEYYVDPPEFARPGFFEEWHDHVPPVRAKYAEVLERLLRENYSADRSR